jgi:tetratricopeptide (TPR) repeat protein
MMKYHCRLAVLLLIFVLSGEFTCLAGDDKAADQSSKPTVTIDMKYDRAKLETPGVLSAWLVYGFAREYFRNEGFLKENPGAREYRYDFKEEFESRKALVEMWEGFQKDKPEISDDYLDALVRVYKAGFLAEYVWYFFRAPGWGDPPDTLRLKAFNEWRSQHLANHTMETVVYPGKRRGDAKRDEKTAASPITSVPVPGYSPPKNEAAKEHYLKGLKHQDNREHDAAISEYLKAIESDPDFTDAMDNLGLNYRATGRYDEAERWYDKSLSIRPKNKAAVVNLAVLYRLKGEPDKAVGLYRGVIEINPEDPEGYYGLGGVLYEKRDFGESIKNINYAIDRYRNQNAPYLYHAYYIQGLNYYELKSFRKAVKYLELALAGMPDDPKLRGKIDEAKKQLAKETDR